MRLPPSAFEAKEAKAKAKAEIGGLNVKFWSKEGGG